MTSVYPFIYSIKLIDDDFEEVVRQGCVFATNYAEAAQYLEETYDFDNVINMEMTALEESYVLELEESEMQRILKEEL